MRIYGIRLRPVVLAKSDRRTCGLHSPPAGEQAESVCRGDVAAKGMRLNAPRSLPTNRITSLRLIVVIRRLNCTCLFVGLEPERSQERNSRNSVPPGILVGFVTAVPGLVGTMYEKTDAIPENRTR